MNREAIYSALFDRVSAAARVSTKNRRLKHWSDVSPADMPALFMAQRGENPKTTTGQPTVWVMNIDFIV